VLRVTGPGPRPAADCPPRGAPLDIAIPIFNNAALLRRCLDTLLPTLQPGDEVWLIDDASDEPGITALLDDFARRWPGAHLVGNASNLGFVGSSNRAFAMTRRDLVLLNSDTEVTGGWLEHLQACLQRNPRAGIVCPLSDRASLLSALPERGPCDTADIAAAAAATTVGDVPLPTAVGFCMLIRRALIEHIGVFSQTFAPGYGEENDFSMRALRAGWEILAADRACVLHHSGGSFGDARSRVLQAEHRVRLDRIWPEYAPLVQAWWRDNPLRAKTESLAWHGDARTGVVHVLHRPYHVGGTERVARTLIRALSDRYRHTLIYPGETDGAWCDFELRAGEPFRELMLNNRWIRPRLRIAGHGADLTCPQSERALARVVRGSDARIVHFHHMLHWDSLLLPAVARALGCRVVISVHDFWFNCPVHNQLEHGCGQPCGRSHVQPDQRCADCLGGYASGRWDADDPAKNAAVYSEARHALMLAMLEQADMVIAPSRFVRDKLLQAFPSLSERQVRVLPHGVPVPRSKAAASERSGRVLGYFGGDQALKGAGLVLHLARALVGSDLTFRVHGRIKGFDRAALPPNVELRGFYSPDEVGRVLEGVDLALLPSFYEESFSMVASECWAHGVPVLASDRGALRERVQPGVNGWLVPDMTPESWLQALRAVLAGDAIERCRTQLSGFEITSLQQSSAALNDLYQDLLERPAPPAAAAGAAEPLPRFHEKLEALRRGVAGPPGRAPGHALAHAHGHPSGRCLGIVRDHWGTANYRVRFPLEDLSRFGVCAASRFHVVREAGFQVADALRNSGARQIAVQPFLSDEGLGLMERLHRETSLSVTLVVDDLWTALQEDNPARGLMPDDVPGRLAYAASLSHALVLTTRELERRLGLSHDNTHVIENALPDWIWGSLPVAAPGPRERLRVGWSGAPQHAGDLAFLQPVMRATADLADWVFLGLCPEPLRSLAHEFHPMVPFDCYPAALRTLNLDLAIAPLADHAFNRCKSHLKILEYGILGLPVIAADLEPYRQCPVPRAAPDDADAWIAAIRGLLESAEARADLGGALRQWVLRQHMTEHRRPAWAAALGISSDAD
jgi:GT2 family glycosyltransferase/glycosyltransferase involved in cell wall biosynthesis